MKDAGLASQSQKSYQKVGMLVDATSWLLVDAELRCFETVFRPCLQGRFDKAARVIPIVSSHAAFASAVRLFVAARHFPCRD